MSIFWHWSYPVNINKRLFKSHYITLDEYHRSAHWNVISLKNRLSKLTSRLTDDHWNEYKELFIDIERFIGLHQNSTADNPKYRTWVNLPTIEAIEYLNKLWTITNQKQHPMHDTMILDTLKKFYD